MEILNKYNSRTPVTMVKVLKEQNAELVAECKTEQELIELLQTGTKDIIIEVANGDCSMKSKYTKSELAEVCARRVIRDREVKAETARISAQPFAEKARMFNEANSTYKAMKVLDKYCDFEEVKKFAVYFGIDGEQFTTKDALCLAIEEKYYEWTQAGKTIPETDETEEIADEVKPLTIEQMEQETGFTYYRDLGKEFLAGKVSKEELLEKFPRYEYLGFAYGLAVAFDIAIQGKSYSELLSEIRDFVNNYGNMEQEAFEKLSTEEKINALASDKADWSNMTRLVWECERYEMAHILGLDVQAIYQENRENHYFAVDNDYLEVCIKKAITAEYETGNAIKIQNEPEPKAKKTLTFSDVKFTPEQVYSMAKYDYSLAQDDYMKAGEEYYELQTQVNLLREEWLSLKDAIRNFTGKRLAGLRLLEQELRAKYSEIRLKSLQSRKRMQEQSKHLDRELARLKEAEKNFNGTVISHAI